MTGVGGSKNRETANTIVSDVMEFFSVTPQSSKHCYTSIEKLFNKCNLELFLHHANNEKKQNMSTYEMIRRLRLAIEYIMDLSNRKDYYIRGHSLCKLLAESSFSQLRKSSFERRRNGINNSCGKSTHGVYQKIVRLYINKLCEC